MGNVVGPRLGAGLGPHGDPQDQGVTVATVITTLVATGAPAGIPEVVALGEEGDRAPRVEVAHHAQRHVPFPVRRVLLCVLLCGTAAGDPLQVGGIQRFGRGDHDPPVRRQARQAAGKPVGLGALHRLPPGWNVDDDAARGPLRRRARLHTGSHGPGDAPGHDLGEAGVDDEVAGGRGVDDVGQDEVLAVAGLDGGLQQLPADDGLAVLVERVVEEGAALEQGAAVDQQRRGLLDGRVGRAVAVHGEGDLPGVAELGEVAGEARLVPLDGVAVGGDRRHPFPVLTEVRGRQEPAAHRDPVGLEVAGQLTPGQEGVGTHGGVLGHAPEGDVAPVRGAGEDLLPGPQRRVVGVVGQDELVEVGEPLPAQVLQAGPVGADVEPLIGALEDLIAAGLQSGAVGVADG